MIKGKLDKLEKVKINELFIENNGVESIYIIEDHIRSIFRKFKEFVLTSNLPECKKFISGYFK